MCCVASLLGARPALREMTFDLWNILLHGSTVRERRRYVACIVHRYLILRKVKYLCIVCACREVTACSVLEEYCSVILLRV